MKASPASVRAVGRSRRAPDRQTHPAPPQHRSLRLRLRRLALACPRCREAFEFIADTPTQVFDPEVHRFACPACLTVVRLLPYPSSLAASPAGQSEADEQAMAVDILTHPLCAGMGVYDPVEGEAGREQRGVIAVYLYLLVPVAAVS